MSKDRMTDTSWKHYRMDSVWTERDRAIVTAELDRARSEEARLLEERAGLDAKVQALADALEEERKLTGRGECRCTPEPRPYLCVTCRTDDALRLAGRL